MGSSLSQDLVSAFGQQRAVRSPGDLSKTQSVTTCSTVWVGWPHEHDAASCMPQSWRVSPTRAVPERIYRDKLLSLLIVFKPLDTSKIMFWEIDFVM